MSVRRCLVATVAHFQYYFNQVQFFYVPFPEWGGWDVLNVVIDVPLMMFWRFSPTFCILYLGVWDQSAAVSTVAAPPPHFILLECEIKRWTWLRDLGTESGKRDDEMCILVLAVTIEIFSLVNEAVQCLWFELVETQQHDSLLPI